MSMSSGQNKKPTRILCIQLKQLGDVLMTTPAVRMLAQNFPDCEIDFITQRPADTIYLTNPNVSNVYCVSWKLRELPAVLGKIRRQKYDILIDFSGRSKTAFLSWFTGIPKRIGYAGQKKSWCFTETVRVPDQINYAADRKSYLLTALGIDPDDSGLDYFLPEDAARKFEEKAKLWGINGSPLFAISPVSKWEFKVWPAERFADICDRLVTQFDGQIFFLIGPGERHFAENVRANMKQKCLPIIEDLSLYDAACLLDRAACYVGNDNGLMHLSVARKRPTFAVFGRHSPTRWGAPAPIHCTIEHDPGCKKSCHYPACELECLTTISVEMVWHKLERFLKSKL
ncbi:MAG: hypothetical protein GWP56_03145 [Gammaproteobacteria bacterium]|jgi:lipopolysaccharide heptosyltransferase II|nr:hypothetical protein [Gammaproteobacteria bacterium]